MKDLISILILLSVFACKPHSQKTYVVQNTDSTKTILQDTNTIAGNWQLMPVLASDTATGKIPSINFDLKTNRFSGNTGCNSMSGSFQIKQDALTFNENFISTKMACPGYNEQPFLDNLHKVNRYEIKNGVLQLMFNTTILSQWVRHINTNPTKQI
jgi:heat shock protein HslJ